MNYMKMYILIFIGLLFYGCSQDKEGTSNLPVTEKAFTTGTVELGKIKGAEVYVKTLNGHTLNVLENTDSNGTIKIDINHLKAQIESYDPSIKLVKIVSIGGTDTDPNDDGKVIESENKHVYKNVKAIVPVDLIYSGNGYHINLLTSMVAELIENAEQEDIDNEYLDFLVKELDIHDVDKDGNITIKDIIYYDMVKNDSNLESELRASFLDTFHNVATENRKNIIKNYKKYIGFGRVKSTYQNGDFSVKIIKSNKYNKILYGISSNAIEPKLSEYTGDTVYIKNSHMLMFVECTSYNECYQAQKVYFKDRKYYYGYLPENIPSSNYLNKIDTIKDKQKEIDNIRKEIEDLNTTIL